MSVDRLQKIIGHSGLMSRRAAEEHIAAGRVTVDGRKAVLGDRADPSTVDVRVDGVPIPVAPGRVAYLLYKPVGVVSTASDPEGRPTVVDLVPADVRVYPVGRLDVDSEGLLLLTNDGALTHLVTHPSFGITKTYVVRTRRVVTKAELGRLRKGVELSDGMARPIGIKAIDHSRQGSLVEITMGEGRNREVRRMFEAIDHQVDRLVRTSIGPIADRGLDAGEWRELSTGEVGNLYRAARS